jgi:ATP-dependent RNA helicase DDX21
VANFRVSQGSIQALASTGITTLFPIQVHTFDYVYDGRDVIGRARTGTGKTLSFSLPVIERLLLSGISNSSGPVVLCMAPTRELAKQVDRVFKMLGGNGRFTTCCIYGGVPYQKQESALARGVDIVVGTPGRIIDMIDKGYLLLRNLKYFILDEADEMLNMGFREDIEKVFSKTPSAGVQTLLYSATIPDWVQNVATKYLRDDYVIVDLVGSADNLQTAVGVTHLAIQTDAKGRLNALVDVIGVYSKGGKSMIFCDTKKDCNELALSTSIAADCQALHGDIAQNQREVTLKSFREGRFSILVCTDVAARGLDITDVDLIVQCGPPKDVETYIHRSGRTGRAGKTGACVTFYTKWEEPMLKKIEQEAKIKFQRVGIPQQKEIYRSSSNVTLKSIIDVDPEISKYFLDYVKERVIQEFNGDYLQALANCFCVIGGHTEKVQPRSLLTSEEGMTALLAKQEGKAFFNKPEAASQINIELSSSMGKQFYFKEIRLTKDGAAIFDLPSDLAKEVIDRYDGRRLIISMPSTLPDLVEEDYRDRGYRGPGGGRGGGGGRGRGRGNYQGHGGGGGGHRNGGGYNNNNWNSNNSAPRGGGGGSFSNSSYNRY